MTDKITHEKNWRKYYCSWCGEKEGVPQGQIMSTITMYQYRCKVCDFIFYIGEIMETNEQKGEITEI